MTEVERERLLLSFSPKRDPAQYGRRDQRGSKNTGLRPSCPLRCEPEQVGLPLGLSFHGRGLEGGAGMASGHLQLCPRASAAVAGRRGSGSTGGCLRARWRPPPLAQVFPKAGRGHVRSVRRSHIELTGPAMGFRELKVMEWLDFRRDLCGPYYREW